MFQYRKSKQKHQYLVKDGYITFTVTISPELRCQCPSYCCHIEYLLTTIYGLNEINLEYLYQTYTKFVELINKPEYNFKNINKDLIKYITENILDYNCGICLGRLKISDDLFNCKECQKYVHNKCMNKWFIKSKTCIYCKTPL